jgi:phage shock protein A
LTAACAARGTLPVQKEIAMKFWDRLALLVKADAHGVLEQMEERTLLAKQHLREAELELDRKRAQIHACGEESRRLGEEAEHLEREIASLDADVELAIAGGKEDLARFAVRRLLPLRRAAESAHRRTAELDQERARLADTLTVQERQLEELAAQVRTRIAAARFAQGDALARPAPAADEEVELELLRRRATPARAERA